MAIDTTYRVCPETGLKVFSQTEKLIKANAVDAKRDKSQRTKCD